MTTWIILTKFVCEGGACDENWTKENTGMWTISNLGKMRNGEAVVEKAE